MQEKVCNKIKILIIVVAVVVIVLAISIGMTMWFTQIRLTAPVNITVGEVDLHNIQLSWDQVEHATSYGISVYEVDKEKSVQYMQVDKAEIEISSLYANYSYNISVVAYYDKEDVHIESDESEMINVQTLSPEIGRVEDIQAAANGSESITVQWTPYQTQNENADGTSTKVLYTILGSIEEKGTYTVLAENVEGTEYLHEGLTQLDSFYYKVVVLELMDDSIYTGEESDVSAFAITGIGAVNGLKAEALSSSEINISWEPYVVEKTNSDGTAVTVYYTLYGSNSENEEYAVLADKISETTYQEKNLSPETARYYKVSVTAQLNGHEVTGETTPTLSAKTQAKKTTVNSNTGNNTQSSVSKEKDAQARVVAQQIADSITGDSDLEKVRKAAEIISIYCMYSTYTSSDPDYRTPYGLLCKGVYTCAGATRALGLVLECMGYSWEHINENQWTHQWCKVTMDGQVGWADGMGGIADYGKCPFETGEPYIDENGVIYFSP